MDFYVQSRLVGYADITFTAITRPPGEGEGYIHTGPEGVPLLKMPVYLSHRVESTHATFFQTPRQRQKEM